MRQPLLHSLELAKMVPAGAEDWHNLSMTELGVDPEVSGHPYVNWKERAYGTIFDVLMVSIIIIEKK